MQGIGELFQGLAQGAQAGIGLNQNQQRLELADQQFRQSSALQKEQMGLEREKFDMTKRQVLAEISDFRLLGAASGDMAATMEQEEELSTIVETGKKLGKLSPGMRGPLVDQYAAAFQQKYGKPMAPVVIQSLKRAKPEEVSGIFNALESMLGADPSMRAGAVVNTLSDPVAAVDAITALSIEGQSIANTEAATGPRATASAIQKQRIARQVEIVQRRLNALQGLRGKVQSQKGLEGLQKIEGQLQDHILSLQKELRADYTETIDDGQIIREVDRLDGSVLREYQKKPAPTAGSNTLFNVVSPDGKVLGRAVFNSQSNAPRMEGTGAPVPQGAQLQRIGSDYTETLEMGPDGTVRITKGTTGGLMASTQSKLETAAATQEQVALELTELAGTLRQKDLGAAGVTISKFVNNTLGQVLPDIVQTDVTKNRTAMVTARENAFKALRADGGNMSNKDADRVMQIFPSDGIFQSEADAREKLLTVASIVADRAAFNAGKLGRQTITELSPDEIKASVKSGTLDSRTAMRALKLFHPDYLMRLQHGATKP